jgi:hypothetical protein
LANVILLLATHFGKTPAKLRFWFISSGSQAKADLVQIEEQHNLTRKKTLTEAF